MILCKHVFVCITHQDALSRIVYAEYTSWTPKKHTKWAISKHLHLSNSKYITTASYTESQRRLGNLRSLGMNTNDKSQYCCTYMVCIYTFCKSQKDISHSYKFEISPVWHFPSMFCELISRHVQYFVCPLLHAYISMLHPLWLFSTLHLRFMHAIQDCIL